MTKPKPKTAQEALQAMKGDHTKHQRTWSQVAAQLPPRKDGKPWNVGYLHQVAHGTRPANNDLLHALGLPLKSVPAQPCHKCGELHGFIKTCPSKRKPRGTHRVRMWRSLNDLTPKQVAHLLRHREEYMPNG
jgi:hypothetical protein